MSVIFHKCTRIVSLIHFQCTRQQRDGDDNEKRQLHRASLQPSRIKRIGVSFRFHSEKLQRLVCRQFSFPLPLSLSRSVPFHTAEWISQTLRHSHVHGKCYMFHRSAHSAQRRRRWWLSFYFIDAFGVIWLTWSFGIVNHSTNSVRAVNCVPTVAWACACLSNGNFTDKRSDKNEEIKETRAKRHCETEHQVPSERWIESI